MTAVLKTDCFVVMPFGMKWVTEVRQSPQSSEPNAQPKEPSITTTLVDFDMVYNDIIKPAAQDAHLLCTRSDEIAQAGNIQREMIARIIKADVVIVDITSQNANVFYELGIRHSFRRTTTVVVHRAGTHIPFNINGMRSVEYSDRSETEKAASRARIRKAIETSFEGKDVDSLVYTLFTDIKVSRYSEQIMERVQESWRLTEFSKPREIGYITGNIVNIQNIDAWVNAENTQMEMGRLHEDSVSAMIRYYGARRNSAGYIVEDVISSALEYGKGDFWSVEPGMVIATPPGQLGPTNNVKAILHVAALQGEPGRGYLPVRDHPGCVTRALLEVERLNTDGLVLVEPPRPQRPAARKPGWFGLRSAKRNSASLLSTATAPKAAIKSVLIPLFGTRSANLFPQDVADRLFRAAVVFFEMHPETALERIFFLASTTEDKLICDAAIGSLLRAGKHLERKESAGPEPIAASAGRAATPPQVAARL